MINNLINNKDELNKEIITLQNNLVNLINNDTNLTYNNIYQNIYKICIFKPKKLKYLVDDFWLPKLKVKILFILDYLKKDNKISYDNTIVLIKIYNDFNILLNNINNIFIYYDLKYFSNNNLINFKEYWINNLYTIEDNLNYENYFNLHFNNIISNIDNNYKNIKLLIKLFKYYINIDKIIDYYIEYKKNYYFNIKLFLNNVNNDILNLFKYFIKIYKKEKVIFYTIFKNKLNVNFLKLNLLNIFYKKYKNIIFNNLIMKLFFYQNNKLFLKLKKYLKFIDNKDYEKIIMKNIMIYFDNINKNKDLCNVIEIINYIYEIKNKFNYKEFKIFKKYYKNNLNPLIDKNIVIYFNNIIKENKILSNNTIKKLIKLIKEIYLFKEYYSEFLIKRLINYNYDFIDNKLDNEINFLNKLNDFIKGEFYDINFNIISLYKNSIYFNKNLDYINNINFKCLLIGKGLVKIIDNQKKYNKPKFMKEIEDNYSKYFKKNYNNRKIFISDKISYCEYKFKINKKFYIIKSILQYFLILQNFNNYKIITIDYLIINNKFDDDEIKFYLNELLNINLIIKINNDYSINNNFKNDEYFIRLFKIYNNNVNIIKKEFITVENKLEGHLFRKLKIMKKIYKDDLVNLFKEFKINNLQIILNDILKKNIKNNNIELIDNFIKLIN